MASLPAYLVIYDVMLLGSALVFALLILTAICSKRIIRGKAWFGMMSCWFLFALSYGLLVGKQSGPAPASSHCFLQTMLIYAAPPLAAVGTLSFYLDFYLGSCWDPSRRRSVGTGISYFLLALPWLVHLAIDIEVIILAVSSSSSPAVGRTDTGFYCHLNDTIIPGIVNAAVIILVAIVLIPLEVWTGIQLYQSRSIRAGDDFRQYFNVYLRLAGCTIVALVAFGLGSFAAATHTEQNSLQQDFFCPFLSVTTMLIFASQKDLLNALLTPMLSYFFPGLRIFRSVDRLRDEKLKNLEHNGS